jgi:A/G-specific adenine glycosylase
MCGSRRGGQFPSVEAELRAFPGVGRLYRAVAAIASAAAPVDGNIARIVARLTALEEPIARAAKSPAAQALAPAIGLAISLKRSWISAQCFARPRNPNCDSCPLA